jgi:hypothetical protein
MGIIFDTKVILCNWKKQPSGYRLWVKAYPSVVGEGDTIEEAEESLRNAIWEAADDMDTVEAPLYVYEPPLPVSAATERFLKPELYAVRGDEPFEFGPGDTGERMSREACGEWLEKHIDGLYTGGYCRACKSGIGRRTRQTIQIGRYESNSDGGFIRTRGFSGPWYGYVYSDRFLALLTPEERDRLEFQRVQIAKKKGRREYYELLSAPDATFVGVKSLDAEGSECDVCGHISIHYHQEPTVDLLWFVCRSDLPDPLPSCLVVGYNDERYVCFTRQRWDEIRGKPGTKGMVPAPIGVVSEEECDRRPRMQDRSKDCECRSQWPESVTVAGKTRKCWDLPFAAVAPDAPSDRNLEWIKPALEAGTIQISRQTLSLEDVEALIQSGKRPKQLGFVSFRCPKCWRLGWIIAKPRELSFIWW